MGLFSPNKDKPAAVPAQPVHQPQQVPLPSGAKTAPTPKRRDAEAARRQRVNPQLSPKDAKRRARADATVERRKRAEALDSTPGKVLMRGWVDTRFNLAEWSMPILMLLLLLVLVASPAYPPIVEPTTYATWAFILFIDDGGEALKLRSQAKASVPGDGRPHRVPLMAFTSPTSTEHVLLPELAEAVILKSVHVNRSQQPILAGPVDLVRAGGFVGRSSLLFIAPGEKFAIGWGPDGAIRVQRSVELAREDRGMMSSWTTQAHLIKVKISNLGALPRTVHFTERVPVSEVEKLRIEVDAATTDKARADANGFLHWTVELPGFGRKSVELKYLVRKHADVVGV